MSTKQKQQQKRVQKRAAKKRQRQRAMPSPSAYAFTLHDAMAMGAPAKTKIYELGKKGVLDLFRDAAGRRMVGGNSLRKLLGVKEDRGCRLTKTPLLRQERRFRILTGRAG